VTFIIDKYMIRIRSRLSFQVKDRFI